MKRNRNGQAKSTARQCRYGKPEQVRTSASRRSPMGDRTAAHSARLVFEPRSEWHAAPLPPLPPLLPPTNPPLRVEPGVLDRIRQYAMSLLEADNKHYPASQHASSSSSKFYSSIMSSGTLSDKISALTLVVQESPLHSMKALENLIGLARKRSRGQSIDVLKALKDLLAQGAVLPSHRKLRFFVRQPDLAAALQSSGTDWKLGQPLPGSLQDVHLVCWAYEDWLKNIYFELLRILELWCNDGVEFARSRAVAYVWELLKEKPEQESNLLRLLVNKLGDPEKKIASKVSFLLLQLESAHPLMKPTIISAVESELLYRPGQSSHAKYYALITLNQTVLSVKERGVAGKLAEIYFSQFVSLLKWPEKKIVSAVSNPIKLNKKGQVQGGGSAAGKHSKCKDALKQTGYVLDDELREKMISAVLTGVNRAIPFTNTDSDIFEQHLNTLFKVTHCSNFNTSIQALMLIQQLGVSHQQSSDRFYRALYESLLDPRLITSSKQAMFLNLLFKAMRSDNSSERVLAFTKRLLQIASLHQPPFICGILYLVHELRKSSASLRTLLDRPEEHVAEAEEVFHDAPDEADIAVGTAGGPNDLQDEKQKVILPVYDGRKRDPQHSHADKSCLWELVPFLAHFHPSVSLYASSVMSDDSPPNKPDLSLHTLIHFLDRFVYRNARSASAGPKGNSIMQPLAGGDASHLLASARYTSRGQRPVNSDAFIRLESRDVAADEAFFHDYFNRIGKANAVVQRTGTVIGRDAGTAAEDDDNESDIWKALVKSRPELEDDEQSDIDIDMELEMEELLSDPEGDSLVSDGKHAHGAPDEDMSEAGGDIDADLDLESEAEAFVASDTDLPSDIDRTLRDELESTGSPHATAPAGKLSIKKRRKLKHLPTFASADSYAAMLSIDNSDS